MGRKIRVLILGDENRGEGSVSTIVSAGGYRVDTFDSVKEGLENLGKWRSKAVIICKTGNKIDKDLNYLHKVVGKFPDIPVILISNKSSIDSALRAFRMGAYDYISIPFDAEELYHSLKRACEHIWEQDDRKNAEKKLKKIVRELKKKNKEVEKLSQFKSFMMSMAGHDLKTIFTVLNGYNKMMWEQVSPRMTDEEKSVLNEGTRSLKRAMMMVESILDYHSVESGAMNLQMAQFNIFDPINECIDFLQPYGEMKNVTIERKGKDKGVPVYGDRLKVMQILDNLITNSIKFTSSGGVISVVVNELENDIIVRVRDNGCGIPMGRVKNILSSSPSIFKREGTGIIGLGLSICKRLVEVQGGTFEIKSQPGKGTEVLFSLNRKRKTKDHSE